MLITRATLFRCIAVAALATCTLVSAPAWAQPDTPQSRRAAADALVKSINDFAGPERIMKMMQSNIEAATLQQVRSATHLTAAQQERVSTVLSAEMSAAMSDLFKEIMPGMIESITNLYVERFSLAELQELLRFHTSAVGVKSMTVMMDDMPRMMQPMMRTVETLAPRLAQRMQAVQARLKDEGIDLTPPRR